MSNMNDEVPATLALALANASPRALRRVGIIGATATGLRIAMDLIDAELPVTLFEIGRASLDGAMAPLRAACRDAAAQGELARDPQARRMALLMGTVNFHHLKDCDLIIDTVCTDTAGRESLFRRLDQTARPGAVLVTLAAHAGVDRLARCTRRAGEVLGLHVPAAAVPGQAWELVRGTGTSGDTLATVVALARKLGYCAAVSDACHGSVIEAGAGAWRVEQALD